MINFKFSVGVRGLCEWKWNTRIKSIFAVDTRQRYWFTSVKWRKRFPVAGGFYTHSDGKIGKIIRKHNWECIRRNASAYTVPVIIIIEHSICHSFSAWKRFPHLSYACHHDRVTFDFEFVSCRRNKQEIYSNAHTHATRNESIREINGLRSIYSYFYSMAIAFALHSPSPVI